MRKRSTQAEFAALAIFLVGASLVLTNGFSARIFAQDDKREVFEQIEPIGDVIAEVLKNYVREPDLDRAVEGALAGIMNSLDRNSSYLPAEGFQSLQEDTQGEFDGIGVHIRMDEQNNVVISYPEPEGPAAKVGIHSGDYIVGIEGVSLETILAAVPNPNPNSALQEVSSRIKGPRGTRVGLTVSRAVEGSDAREQFEFTVERGKIPMLSILESRVLEGGIGYVRVADFKKNSASELRKELERLQDAGMKSLVLDLRWNPGGLLNASREVCELFLPKNSLVVSTRGRETAKGSDKFLEQMTLYTEKQPVIPETTPLLLLVNGGSASSSEIVTGALQFYRRALVVGEKTYGKGSVQTIIPLTRPAGAALRLTTALYYTPANVTIDSVGILPDVEVTMTMDQQRALYSQMLDSYQQDPERRNEQNHGRVTGDTKEGVAQDLVLERAVEVVREQAVWSDMLRKYHKDVKETQVAQVDPKKVLAPH
jgi:carboxyl-terminal processing protease